MGVLGNFWNKARWLLAVLAFTALAVAAMRFVSNRADGLPTPDEPTAFSITFGLSREAANASMLFDACDHARQEAQANADLLVEDAKGNCVDPSTMTNPPAAADRPAIVSTTVQRDLVRCDSEGGSGDRVFPADQITAATELVGATGLGFLVTANPRTPTEVPEGAYCGRIVTERAAGPYSSVSFAIIVKDRGGFPMLQAALYLLIGAFGGMFIRFLNDPVAGLIGPYRRLRSVRRWFSAQGDFPDRQRVELLLDDIAEALWYLDKSAAEALLEKAEQVRDAADEPARQTIVAALPAAGRSPAGDVEPQLRRQILFAVFGNYWLVALGAVLVVVVASGIWQQYFEQDAFSGSDRDWIGLVIFGLAAQVTASTTAEALGKLLPSGTRPPAV